MATYSSNHAAFIADWCAQYQEMSLLGVNPAPFALTDGWTPPSPAPSPTPKPTPGGGGGGGGGGKPSGGGGGGKQGGVARVVAAPVVAAPVAMVGRSRQGSRAGGGAIRSEGRQAVAWMAAARQ